MSETHITPDTIVLLILSAIAAIAWYFFRRNTEKDDDGNGRRMSKTTGARIMERLEALAGEMADMKVSIATIIEKLSHHDAGAMEMKQKTEEMERRMRWIETEHAKNHGHGRKQV